MRVYLIIFFLLSINGQSKVPTILLDPGHGGSEHGAKYLMSLYEKDLALKLTKIIKRKLQKKNFKVYLTRSIDKSLGLKERAALADFLNPDIFISVHINSAKDKHSRGIETYYLNNNRSAAVKKIEDVENSELRGDKKLINKILIELIVENTAGGSKKLGKDVHRMLGRRLSSKYKIPNRGIRPGLFYVLALSKRPSILLEAGFLSNKMDRKLLTNNKYLNDYAQAVADGVGNFFKVSKYLTVSQI